MRGWWWIAIAVLLAGCPYDPDPSLIDASRVRADGPWFDDAGVPYCWIFDCPTDLGADVCGTCTHPLVHVECPPGFLCTCDLECIRGPFNFDGRPACEVDAAGPDAGPDPDAAPSPDARIYEWPACNEHPIPD